MRAFFEVFDICRTVPNDLSLELVPVGSRHPIFLGLGTGSDLPVGEAIILGVRLAGEENEDARPIITVSMDIPEFKEEWASRVPYICYYPTRNDIKFLIANSSSSLGHIAISQIAAECKLRKFLK